MWILNKGGNVLYAIGEIKEIYIVDFLDIELCFGKTLNNKHCKVLGKYDSFLEAEWAFRKLVDWMENPGDKQVFRMPYEMPKELREC